MSIVGVQRYSGVSLGFHERSCCHQRGLVLRARNYMIEVLGISATRALWVYKEIRAYFSHKRIEGPEPGLSE
jgi:hypothetical protein